MYYFALLDDNGVCITIEEWGEYNGELEGNPYYVQVPEYNYSLIRRKKYVNGEWVDATATEGQNYDGMHLGLRGEWLDDIIDNLDSKIENHTHDGYASQSDLDLLEGVVGTKANATHTHDDYATAGHIHDGYVEKTDFDSLVEEVNNKADFNHIHNNYADVSHTHTEYAATNHFHSNYASSTHEHEDYSLTTHTHTASEVGAAPSTHNHNGSYASVIHNHDSVYSNLGHDHNEDYAPLSHSHNNYATTTALNELSDVVSGKANVSHSHGDLYYTEDEIDEMIADKASATHNHTGVYDESGSAANALTSAKAYTDSEVETLNESISAKANASDLTTHTGNTTIHITNAERTNWNSAKTHANSTHAPSNAEPNQNAFSNIVIGSTTISADNATDTLTLVAGSNITLTPDSTGDSVTISSANTVYTHPTSTGNKHIPAGGSSGQILRWASDGTAVWGNDNNTTYSNATQSAPGLMSNTDKTKLDGIANGANNYTLPSAGTNLGGVKSGGDVTISAGIITVNDDSHNHIISNIDGLQSALDSKAASSHSHNDIYFTETEINSMLSGKANSSHGAHVSYSTAAPVMDGAASVGSASTVARSDHKHPTDTSRAAKTSLDSHTGNKSNPHGVTIAQLGLTATASELNYVDGVTSNIQTQLNGKAASSHTHSAATTSTNGFMSASDKSKLDGIVFATVSEVETYLNI